MNIKINNGQLIIDSALVSCEVGDVFSAGGLNLPQVSATRLDWLPSELKLTQSMIHMMAAGEKTTRRIAGEEASKEIVRLLESLAKRVEACSYEPLYRVFRAEKENWK